MAQPPFQQLIKPNFVWIRPDGTPKQEFGQWAFQADAFLRAVALGNLTLIGVAAPGNANAAAAGVPLNGLYRGTADPAIVYMRTV